MYWLSLTLGVVSIALSGPPVTAPREASPGTRFLGMGISQFRDGDFDAAVFTLDTAVRKLQEESRRTVDLSRAYAYLGATYVALAHEDAAKGKFREALRLDPELRLDPGEFSPAVIKVFDTQLLTQTVAEKRRRGKLFVTLGAIGAAAAVGISAATNEGGPPDNRAPTVDIGFEPPGEALTGITTMTFTASGADPDGDALTYRWNFGDGTTATGETARHLYDSAGVFVVEVAADDGRGRSSVDRVNVTARTLGGAWKISGHGGGDRRVYQCAQAGHSFDCQTARLEDCSAGGSCEGGPTGCCYVDRWHGTLTDPRGITALLEIRWGVELTCRGEVTSDLRQVHCVVEDGTPHEFTRE